jgi:NAD(P)-dependent dehydrogenase (short-subunit alcohol dehydrogenase family)
MTERTHAIVTGAGGDYAARAARVIPLGEFQTPMQVARATAFLCSPDADYITGTVLTADGGCSLFHLDDPT